jgi:acyl-homoserine lactone acylase PvdQ
MGLLNMMFSQSKEDFFKYTNLVQSINVDMAFIDREKNFGYVSMGRIPKREIPEMGSFVKDGSTDIYDMKGYYNE